SRYLGAYIPLTGRSTSSDECRFVYVRNSQTGSALKEKAYHPSGQLGWVLQYTNEDRLTPQGQFLDAEGYPFRRSQAGALYVAFVRSGEGYEVETRFLDKDGQPQPNDAGEFGYRMVHNP